MKSKNLIKSILLVGGVAIATVALLAGCGKKKEETKTYDKENEVVPNTVNQVKELNNNTAQNTVNQVNELDNNIARNTVIQNNTNSNVNKTQENTNKTVAAFNKSDLNVKGITFGSSKEEVIKFFGTEFDAKEYEEGASGDTITEMKYGDEQLKIIRRASDEYVKIDSITIDNGSIIKTSRGIGIGSSKSDILKAYPTNSILKNTDKSVVVGFPGDNDEYASQGRIYFSLNGNKVTSISFHNNYAE